MIADMQPSFCCGDDGSNIDPTNEVPTDRWHSLQQSGAVLAFSSDWPCTWPPDPFVSIQQTATRQVWKSADTANIGGEPLDGAAQGGAHGRRDLALQHDAVGADALLHGLGPEHLLSVTKTSHA